MEYLIERIAGENPDKWVFCIDLFTFAADFDPSSKKQKEFREIVRNAVERLGLPKLIYLNGRTILKELSGLTFDLVHPAPAGMEEIAANLSHLIKEGIERRR